LFDDSDDDDDDDDEYRDFASAEKPEARASQTPPRYTGVVGENRM
jgi:hypothetical protein